MKGGDIVDNIFMIIGVLNMIVVGLFYYSNVKVKRKRRLELNKKERRMQAHLEKHVQTLCDNAAKAAEESVRNRNVISLADRKQEKTKDQNRREKWAKWEQQNRLQQL